MAEQRYRIGVKLYMDGRYGDAAREFEVALDLYPKSARLAFNLGRAMERAGELHGAVAAYRRYIALEPDAAQRAEVERIIAALSRRLDASRGRLTVRSVPAGARIFLDGRLESAGKTPLALDVDAGVHRVRFDLAAHTPESREVEVTAGRTAELVVSLDEAGGRWRRPVGWAAAGVGAASVATGVVLYALAADAVDEAEGLHGEPDRYETLEGDFDARHTGAWVALGAGAALVAIGATLVVWGPDEVSVTARPGGAGVVGRW